jgi:hypothetical protein
LCAQDRHHDTCPQSFQLQIDANFTIGLHLEVQIKKNMLVELCAGNYATRDGLVNGVDGIPRINKNIQFTRSHMDIFDNPKCGQHVGINNAHLYGHEIHPTWTPIEPISKDIQIGSNSFHIIKRIQFPIQLAITCTIH